MNKPRLAIRGAFPDWSTSSSMDSAQPLKHIRHTGFEDVAVCYAANEVKETLKSRFDPGRHSWDAKIWRFTARLDQIRAEKFRFHLICAAQSHDRQTDLLPISGAYFKAKLYKFSFIFRRWLMVSGELVNELSYMGNKASFNRGKEPNTSRLEQQRLRNRPATGLHQAFTLCHPQRGSETWEPAD